jgi:Leucine-rich repeat (LRR) protein
VSVETFANVSALVRLVLSYNYLRSVDINILKLLPGLSEMYLNFNEISEIIQGTFEISLVDYLDLGHNRLEHLGSDVFYGLVELRYIDLEGNKLQYINPDTFEGLPDLRSLFLSKNPDLQIPTDRQFINSHSLKKLYISDCNISSVSVETFVNVNALVGLDLSYNNLRSLDIILKVLPNLSALNLSANPLQCDSAAGSVAMVSGS